ncbi:MAG: 50S ribosomal protein L18 [Candidatus Bathyarchaeota archaeon]|nr:50S ribosomal protein L18 [Candidatus Bathyarchaeota archaeon]MDH5788047.1 50S ribosomal protein L18 [Candidatus Bathyarchaeota archaeon]
MPKNSLKYVPFRRRREGKTDYRKRKGLVLSGKPRLVVRGTLNNITAQIIVAKPKGDEVIVSSHSRELARKYGWKAPRGNLPAAYLTGLVCGLKAKASDIGEAILDIGLHSPSKGARVFAALKGILDAGVDVPCNEEKLPDEKKVEGEHIAKYAENLATNPEEYQSKFSRYLEQKISPDSLPKHFAEVKADIIAAFKNGGKKT